MAALIQTIAVLDNSGKAISTSKHLVNVFREAKAAYRERKAEVVAGRHYEIEDRKARKGLEAATVYDNRPAAGPRKHSRPHHGNRRSSTDHRRPEEASRSESNTIYPSSHNRFSQELRTPHSPTFPHQELTRRHSGLDDVIVSRAPRLPPRSMTSPSSPSSIIDMDLAYGPIPPPLPVANPADDSEFKGLVNKVKALLEEADCLQYSVSATIASLQKNPDAMAAVALTLAEISNIATKMAPGVLVTMKGSAPAVFALLASPQFLIAGGVAVGVTIVALGGYKIIKKIRANNAVEDPGMDEMLEIGGDVSAIDNWRRGIAEAEEQSLGTSVDGEFITPEAFTLSKSNLNDKSASETRRKEVGSGSKKSSSAKGASETSSKTGSKGSSRGSSRGSSKESEQGGSKGKREKKAKKPSPLRLMFT
ncbi:hypothetical protein HO173_001670 [Letharia columbiana]|uniref:Uncharacterized protein n=1 Tax=Letharia columbiana TaxID=112416 RepID=A0A8H6L940_9LECA|nr:uncharacterized protein HO173_001670 [Letharia columbiana]KAF6240060.1 hypothetical protein HO173_001670 [Letharia columbiana]